MVGEAAHTEVKVVTRARRARNPYWGLGWVGLVGAALLIGAIALRLLKIDLFYELQYRVAYGLGPQQVLDLSVLYTIARMVYDDAPFGLMGALILVACLAWCDIPRPRRNTAIRWLLIIGALYFTLSMVLIYNRSLRPLGQVDLGGLMISVEYDALTLIQAILVAIVLARVTRSAAVGRISLGLALFCWTLLSWEPFWTRWFTSPLPQYVNISIVINLIVSLPLFVWCVHRQNHPPPLNHCPSCEYDLAGLGSVTTCPECGAEFPELSTVSSGNALHGK